MSERATGESAWLLPGLTGHAYAEGMAEICIAAECVQGILFLWSYMAEPIQTRFPGAGASASLVTGTLAAVTRKTRLAEPAGISERLASYIVAFAAAILFSLLFPEKSKKQG